MTFLAIGGITSMMALGIIKTVQIIVSVTELVDEWRDRRRYARNKPRRLELPMAIVRGRK